jgi:hypothetical protein
MTFTIEITDTESLRGITAAREAYNANTASTPEEIIGTDAGYIQFVMEKATESWAKQYPVP